VVIDYQWLTQAQMMDGLALGESTPGPLIMIVAFVGFVAGWQQTVYADPLWSGMLAASVCDVFYLFAVIYFYLFRCAYGRGHTQFTQTSCPINRY
jgi:chromate transporter